MAQAIITLVDNESGTVDIYLTLDPGADLNDPNVELTLAQKVGVEIVKQAHFSQQAANTADNS